MSFGGVWVGYFFLVVGGFVSVEEEAVKESFIFDGVAVDDVIIVVALSLFLLCVYLPSLCAMLSQC